jgi:hypothetical protein
MRGSARVVAARLLEAWLARETTRVAIGLNTWEGVDYLDRDRLRDLLSWAVRLDTIDAADAKSVAASTRAAARLADAAEASGYRVDRLREELGAPPKVAKTPATKAASRQGKRPAVRAAPRRTRKPALPEQDPPQE